MSGALANSSIGKKKEKPIAKIPKLKAKIKATATVVKAKETKAD